ncbi:hypothetical protein TBR22_A22220 [Luteitalea sp. TBR-22]|uniref:hypothetical protein n=1 Tax=Luteitalea sp. TBR-22 TaxID=2802971 RepID=UPI001AF2A556|nr:hypothetical protein [Luteitalea sp. TBR-22]BCS32997.1 hypothetical protein TBR22_A22220 [Luteitalea sp. TBR-22]
MTMLLPLMLLAAPGATAVAQVAPRVVTCRSIGLDPLRIWRLQRAGDTWRLAHWRGRVDEGAAVRVALPASADVRVSSEALAVRGKSSNGGIDVTLTGTPAAATLDVYISYELEVNVDASLTPRIDEIATDGPIGVRCEVTQD